MDGSLDCKWLEMNLNSALRFYRRMHEDAMERGGDDAFRQMQRKLARNDLFYLMVNILGRGDMVDPWIYRRCREYQREPYGHLDLWAREHYKSTIITFGMTLWLIIRNPNISIGIFSHTRPMAKAFLVQIKREMELNERLKMLWPEIFYEDPASQAPKWSEDEGIIVKRRANMKESTVEAWGLVDGQPTSKHFLHRIYDDVVTRESVTTPEQIKKTLSAYELSDNLGAQGGTFAMAGTRYHQFDTYYTLMERKAVVPRIHPCTKNGRADGEPVLMTREALDEKYKTQGIYTFSTQMLLNPQADKKMGFKDEWVKHHGVSREASMSAMTRVLLIDPANAKRKENDYSSFWVIGLGADQNYYLLDGIRDRLNLTERSDALFRLHRRWRPQVTGSEEYGLNSDIQFYRYQMQNKEIYSFEIVPLGGKMSKNDRILRLVPIFEKGRMFLPHSLLYRTLAGETIDLVQVFLKEEYTTFPVMAHDDMLDNMARVLDENLQLQWPDPDNNENTDPEDSYKPLYSEDTTEIDWQTL